MAIRSIPRPALLAILGAALILVAFVATRGGGEGDDAGAAGAPPFSPRPASTTPAAPKRPAGPGRARSAPPRASKAPPRSSPPAREPAVTGVPTAVARALGHGKVVVLFFSQRGAADDAATAASVRSLKSLGRRVAVFSDRIEDLGDYRGIVAGLDISQAPSIAIVRRARGGLEARVIEGFVDPGSLRQHVQDALR